MSGKFQSLSDAYNHFKDQGGGGASFFSLKDDGDSATVRFLHDGEEDLDWYIVHETEIAGKKKKIKCTEEADCPACQQIGRPQLKIFLQLITKEEPDKLKVWERGRKFIPKIMSFIQRYGTLSGQSIDVERMGRKGDTNTDYQLYPLQRDDKTTADLPEREQLAGKNSLVLDLTKDEMLKLLNGQAPQQPQQAPPANRYDDSNPWANNEPVQKREPKNTDIF